MAIALSQYVTEDEYLEFEEKAEHKHEYFAGHIFAMAGGSIEHALIAGNVLAELRGKTLGRCTVYTSDLRVRVESTGLNTYPDVTLVCGKLRTTSKSTVACLNPTVLVEVLSDSTQAYDRGEKWRHYQTIGSLQAYILVCQDRPRVEMYHRLADGGWKYTLVEGLEAELSVTSIKCELQLAEVYRDVEFPQVPVLRAEFVEDDWS